MSVNPSFLIYPASPLSSLVIISLFPLTVSLCFVNKLIFFYFRFHIYGISYSIWLVVQSLSRVLLLWLHGLQHARLPCPSLSPRVCSNSCSLSQWCHPSISSSVAWLASLCLELCRNQVWGSGGNRRRWVPECVNRAPSHCFRPQARPVSIQWAYKVKQPALFYICILYF